MSRSKEIFRPRNEHEVKVFTCGPSIYRRPHIGNYRTFLYEDVLVRYLGFKGFEVDRVINFTDVEDKTISEAVDKKQKMRELTEEVAKHFYHETKLLKIKLPTKIPSSSTSVDQAVDLIKKLVDKGYAYWYDGDVFFEPMKFRNFGKLYHLDLTNWPEKNVRFKKDTYNGNRWNRGDFILWHGYKEGDIAYWDTEIGRGRPSWNIQDPAMITSTLGYEIDINCGGIDNIYRHHDYNLAIIESLSGKTYANYYLHGEHLIVDGTKMSKSHGNILYPDELSEEGINPIHLRFFLTSTKHYRRKLNYTLEGLKNRASVLEELRDLIASLTKNPRQHTSNGSGDSQGPQVERLIDGIVPAFERRMDDDLNLPGAVQDLRAALGELTKIHAGPLCRDHADRLLASLKKTDEVFAFLF